MLRKHTAIAILAACSLTYAGSALVQEMMMPKPTQEHATIMKSVGDWEGTITMHLPGMPSTPNKAKETVTAFGGFWATSEFSCDFMGMPYQGHGCHGYDQNTGKFTGTWIDNMSSYLSVMEGEYIEGEGLVMTWEAPDMTGQMAPHKSVRVGDDNAYTMTFWTGEQKSMVIDMKRVGAKAMEAGAK